MSHIFIIAEAGVNHNGSLKMAKQLIDAAVEAKADAVKFQTFKAEAVMTKTAPKASYQKKTAVDTESQFDMVKKLELGKSAHQELYAYCEAKGIMFLSAPFDLESIDLLNELGLKIFKIPSGEITNYPYLTKIGKLKKHILLSTGMADLSEIAWAINLLVEQGTSKDKITVLHCHTEYPTKMEDANLLAMQVIKSNFDVEVGYSDHTLGIEAPIAAAALGATVIEKHFTLDRMLPGPDHQASLEPGELSAMIKAVRNIEKALGQRIKTPSAAEEQIRSIVRKSIVAARDIKKGEIFTEESLTIKRPGTGISPMRWTQVIGQLASRDFKKDGLITL